MNYISLHLNHSNIQLKIILNLNIFQAFMSICGFPYWSSIKPLETIDISSRPDYSQNRSSRSQFNWIKFQLIYGITIKKALRFTHANLLCSLLQTLESEGGSAKQRENKKLLNFFRIWNWIWLMGVNGL